MHIVALSGSPSASSRSTALLRHALARCAGATSHTEILLRDLPAQALLRADLGDPAVRAARDQVLAARVVLVATPIYKAAYSGLLKTFLDLLPQDALRGRSVLALGTGGSTAHLLALDYSLKPVLSALGARHQLDAVYAVDAQLPPDGAGGYVVDPAISARIDAALLDLPAATAAPPRLLAAAA